MNTVRSAMVAFNRCRSHSHNVFASRLNLALTELVTGPVESLRDAVCAMSLVSSLDIAVSHLPISSDTAQKLHLFSKLWWKESLSYFQSNIGLQCFDLDCALYAVTAFDKPSDTINQALLEVLTSASSLYQYNNELYVTGIFHDGDIELKAYRVYGIGLVDCHQSMASQIDELSEIFTPVDSLEADADLSLAISVEHELNALSKELKIVL